MTGAAAMTAFTPAAEARLIDYLAQVRQALYANPDVSPDEVEADVREHIDTEFVGLNRPVTLGELDVVLNRLGPPTQWATAGAVSQPRPGPGVITLDWKAFVSAARRRMKGVFATLWRGPEDWRLAYITFALTLLAPLTAGLSLVVAYFFGRAASELARDKGEPLGARRWLIYPAVVVVSLPLFLGLMFAPAVIVSVQLEEERTRAARYEFRGWEDSGGHPLRESERAGYEQLLSAVRALPGTGDVQEVLFLMFVFVGTLAAWWTILGLAMWAFPKWATTLFHPLLDGYDYLHGVRLAACGGVGLLVWIGFACRMWQIG